MKTISVKLYNYDELSEDAKQRALHNWNEDNNDPLMQSHMINLLKEELDERGITYDVDSMDVRYSLSHNQGDGFMFEGKIDWQGKQARVKHSGSYYHSYCKNVEWYNLDALDGEPVRSTYHDDTFEKMYQKVCDIMEQKGYDYIEYMQSEENFIEACDANEYTFEENGKMRNA